jgi:hypothetical protein
MLNGYADQRILRTGRTDNCIALWEPRVSKSLQETVAYRVLQKELYKFESRLYSVLNFHNVGKRRVLPRIVMGQCDFHL